MPWTRPGAAAALLLAASALLAPAALAPRAVAQEKKEDAPLPVPPPPVAAPGEEVVSFTSPKDGWTLLDLLEAVNRQTGRSVIYSSDTKKKVESKRLQFMGSHTLPKARLFDWLQGVLSFESYILIPIGPSGHEQWMVVDVTNPAIRSRPTYVAEEDLEKWKDRDGVYIVATLRVKNLDAADLNRARTGFQQLLTTTNTIGRINEVPGQNAFIIADFAPVVYAMKRLLEAMDVPISENKQVLVRVQIKYALASDISQMLNDLLSNVTPTGQPRRPVNPQQPQLRPDPQIIDDNRTNSLILYAVPEDIAKMQDLIAQLDTEYRGKSNIRFHPLKYQEVEDVAPLLEDLIRGTSSSAGTSRTGTSRSSSRSSRSRNTPSTPGNPPPQTPFGGVSAGEGEPVIIADEKNNSLIIHATDDQYEDLKALIEKLDRPRKQVLIETALMELSVGDTFDFGIDLFGVNDRIAVDTNGDGEVDTFTDSRQFFGTSFNGNSDIVSQNVNGIDVPIGVSPTIGRGLTAGVIKNGRIPAILKALQERTPAKVLSVPSIVASDNTEAVINITETVPYKTVTTTTQNTTESFASVNVDTNLTISPSISADEFLRLKISQKFSTFKTPPAGQPPPTTSRSIDTELLIPNASTVVLGGIVTSQENESRSGVPFLMDIPVLGYLFSQTHKQLNRTNLYLFVTPTIMKDLATFSDYHRLTWEKKVQQDELFGEEVKLLGTRFLGPAVPRTAEDAVHRLDASGTLDAYRYGEEPSEAERVEGARKAWEEMEREKAADAPAPPPAPAPEPPPAPPVVPEGPR